MAGTFTPTTSYSNLTVLELEQLRKGDFTAGGRTLTVGDAGTGTGSVGKGDITAEPFPTGPSLIVDDVQNLLLAPQPGTGLLSQSFLGATSAQGVNTDVVNWYGPTLIYNGTTGTSTGALNWTDTTANNFNSNVILAGDILLIKAGGLGVNNYIVGIVATVNSTSSITLSSSSSAIAADSLSYPYVIVRKNAVQLFALPGSGATGQEQTFFMVDPYPSVGSSFATSTAGFTINGTLLTATGANFTTNGTAVGDIFVTVVAGVTTKYRVTQIPPNGGLLNTQLHLDIPQSNLTATSGNTWQVFRSIHNATAPTVDQINSVRLKNVVSPDFSYTASPSLNRSDAVFPSPAPFAALNTMGYRPVLYPDDTSGIEPNMGAPIPDVNPIADASLLSSDQRMTIDLKAGVVRFSTAPAIGGQIKVAGGVNALTGRLNLYATFWSMNITASKGAAKGLYNTTSTASAATQAASILWNPTNNVWDVAPGFKVPLLSDPLLRASSADNPPDIYQSTSYTFTPAKGLGTQSWGYTTPDAFGAIRAVYGQNSGTFAAFQIQQNILTPILNGQVITVRVRFKRNFPSSTGSLQAVVSIHDASGGVGGTVATIATLNATDTSVQDVTVRMTIPSGYVFLTSIAILASASVTYGVSNNDIFEVHEVQAFLHPATLTSSFSTVASIRNVVENKLRFFPFGTPRLDNPILYAASGNKLISTRADVTEDASHIPPTLDHRGQLFVGGGLAIPTSARVTNYIDPHLAVTNNRSRTLVVETKKENFSNFASARTYSLEPGVDPSGFPEYALTEITHNAAWNPTNQKWYKDQGSGSGASKLTIQNSSVQFQVESSAASSLGDDTTTPLLSGIFGSYTITGPDGGGNWDFTSFTDTTADFSGHIGDNIVITSPSTDNGVVFSIASVSPNNTAHGSGTSNFLSNQTINNAHWNVVATTAWVPGPIAVGAITGTSVNLTSTAPNPAYGTLNALNIPKAFGAYHVYWFGSTLSNPFNYSSVTRITSGNTSPEIWRVTFNQPLANANYLVRIGVHFTPLFANTNYLMFVSNATPSYFEFGVYNLGGSGVAPTFPTFFDWGFEWLVFGT